MPEVQRLLSEGIASVADIDRILTAPPASASAPSRLPIWSAFDVQHAVMELIYRLFYNEPAFSPFPLGAARRRGFLWPEDRGWLVLLRERQENRARRCRGADGASKWVWLRRSTQHAELQVPLIELLSAGGATLETGEAPTAEAQIVVTPIGYDLTSAVVDLKLEAARTVAIDVLFGMKAPRTLMVTPATDPKFRDAVHGLIAADGQPVVVINDSPGFVA